MIDLSRPTATTYQVLVAIMNRTSSYKLHIYREFK